ncbi:hypothetical protein HK102_003393, partial [Quaeritorhiza haematococci]
MGRFPWLLYLLGLAVTTFNLVNGASLRQSTTQNTSPLIFNPRELSLDDVEKSGNFFGVRMSSPLTGQDTARVHFQANGLKFSVCNVEFNSSNWNVSQNVFVSVIPIYSSMVAGEANITITARVCRGRTTTTQRYYALRNIFPGATCSSVGDPHITTFDGLRYDSHSIGTFWLVRSPWLFIQTKQIGCRNRVACNAAIAVQYKEHVYILLTNATSNKLDYTLYRNGNDDTFGSTDDDVVSENMTDVTVFSNKAGTRHEIVFRDHTQISFTVSAWSGFWTHNIQVFIPAKLYNQVHGLCGSWDKNQDNEFLLPDGNVARNPGELAEAWRVSPDQDLFELCASDPTQCNLDFYLEDDDRFVDYPGSICSLPPTCSGDGTTTTTVPRGLDPTTDDIPPYSDNIYHNIPVTAFTPRIYRRDLEINAPTLSPAVLTLVRDTCNATIFAEMPLCSFWVDPQPYVDGCILDVVEDLTYSPNTPQNSSFIMEHRRQLYAASCSKVTESIVQNNIENLPLAPDDENSGPGALRKRALKSGVGLLALAKNTQRSYSLGAASCPRTCRGQCTEIGCVCSNGLS